VEIQKMAYGDWNHFTSSFLTIPKWCLKVAMG
jgi:hypothetical protein